MKKAKKNKALFSLDNSKTNVEHGLNTPNNHVRTTFAGYDIDVICIVVSLVLCGLIEGSLIMELVGLVAI